MTGMRRASFVCLLALMGLAWSGCEGESSTVEGGNGGTNAGGSAGSISLDPLGEAGSGEGGAALGGAGSGSEVQACDFEDLADCGMTSIQASYSAANVLLVIDKSSSMDDQPEGFDLNKWDALKAALEPALTEVQEEMSLGLLLYPYGEKQEIPLECFEGCCELPSGEAAVRVGMQPGEDAVPEIMEALNDVGPGGGTPTADALAAAYEYFTAGEGKDLAGDRFVLLATDGGPNCGGGDNTCDAERCTPNLDGQCGPDQGNCCDGEPAYCLDDAGVLAQIEALAEEGISTFVIGIPGTEVYAEYLDQFAEAGGVPNPDGPSAYYAVSAEGGVEALTETFIDITTHLVRACEVELEAPPPDNMHINVAVDCEYLSEDQGDGEGWSVERAEEPGDPDVLVISGEVCDRVKKEGARRVDVIYGCRQVQ